MVPNSGVAVSHLVHERLARQVDALARHDADARTGSDVGIYKTRIACRRLRALLATFRPVFDQDQTEPIRDEVRWIAGVLGVARDEVLVRENLLELIEAEPRTQIHGPVRHRLLAGYDDRAMPDLRAALESPRYLRLRNSLDALVLDPPWSALAGASVGEVAPKLLRKEVKRFDRRTRAAASAEHVTDALHEARKAAKRLRFAAEALKPAAGEPARALAREAKSVTTELGELQDTAVARAVLLEQAAAAARAGEPTATYELLLSRLDTRADQVIASFRATDARAALDSRCRDLIRELGGAHGGPAKGP